MWAFFAGAKKISKITPKIWIWGSILGFGLDSRHMRLDFKDWRLRIGIGVQDLGTGVQDLGTGVQDLGTGVQD